MQSKARQIHIVHITSLFKTCKYAFDFVHMLRRQSAPVSLLEELFKASMPKILYHLIGVTLH